MSGPRGLQGQVQGVGQMGWVNTRPGDLCITSRNASGGQEEPFSRLALAVYCDDSFSHRRAFAHSCLFLNKADKMMNDDMVRADF